MRTALKLRLDSYPPGAANSTAEGLTLNQEVQGSSPWRRTRYLQAGACRQLDPEGRHLMSGTPVRVAWRVADMLVPPWPGLTVRVCSRCAQQVYVDTTQPTPAAFKDAVLVCVPCGFADPELRPELLETYKKARAANSIGRVPSS